MKKNCSQGSIIFSRCALKGGPPINNYFSFAIQTCPEKFQGFQYEESFKNHRNHIAFESANACGVQCWRKQQVSECFISYQWSGFVNEKFRSYCVILNSDYHKEEMHRTSQCSSFDYFNGNMLELGKPSPRRKWWKTTERYFIFEMKGLFSKVVAFIITFSLPASGVPYKIYEFKDGSFFVCLRFSRAGGRRRTGLAYNLLKWDLSHFIEP